jgi:hypothetical protein
VNTRERERERERENGKGKKVKSKKQKSKTVIAPIKVGAKSKESAIQKIPNKTVQMRIF